MDRKLIEEQRASYKARIEKAKKKLENAQHHLQAAQENVELLKIDMAKTKHKLEQLPPTKFIPDLKGTYIPNINYKDVYRIDSSTNDQTAARMRHRGLVCQTEKQARAMCKYLCLIGKIANFANQANDIWIKSGFKRENFTWFVIEADSTQNRSLKILQVYDSILPKFLCKEDAQTVLELLTDEEKKTLAQGFT